MNPRILPGAEPFRYDAGPRGALLIHGFTGSPASMRPLGRWLAEHGVSVVGPRLAGHGTTWQDLQDTTWQDWEREAEAGVADLRSRCSDVIVVGLSVGGALALHLGAKHGDKLRGVVAINPVVRRPDLRLAPVARLFARSVKGVGNDIKKPAQDELVYDRVPLKGANQFGKLLRTVDAELPSMMLPLLVFSSLEDHTVKPANSARVMARAGTRQKELVRLPNSYHVATLDYDAETIFEGSLRFLDRLTSGVPDPRAG
jgi:carboxylesterase